MSVSSVLRGAAVSLALVALLAPTAAHAGKSVHRDAVGDVVAMTFDFESGSEEVTPAPQQTRGDITRSVVQHRAKRVTFKVSMRALPRKFAMSGLFTRVKTDKRSYSVDVVRMPGFGKDAILSTRRGKVVECDGLTHERNDKKRFIAFSVPRECLGNPRWVRLGAGVFHMSNGEKTFLDESHRDGMKNSNSIAVGPKVRR
ncbi:hypothetical protein [Nocardioides sp.]|uniref:hypothetical protein n=1 Tax=Nocardioides sp. TaxID=35761 RepID=UPI002734B297|nr:hypothetical protein [Nocardioides sp.]MDP3891451.1 hypothetical protein [Nocardioides sp.]